MIASFRAELLKLRKRPAVWVLTGIVLFFVLVSDYLLGYASYVSHARGGVPSYEPPALQLVDLLPARLLPNVVGGIHSDTLGLILGPLIAGSEYGWGTLKTAFAQRPTRWAVYAGQVIALGTVLAAIVVLLFASAAASSFAIAGLEAEHARTVSGSDLEAGIGAMFPGLTGEQREGEASRFAAEVSGALEWPTLSQVVGGFAAQWLILAMWSAFGMLLATLFRSAAVGVGLAFVYLFVVEGLIGGDLAQASGAVHTFATALPGANTQSLVTSINAPFYSFQTGSIIQVSPAQASAVITAYAVVFLALGALVLRHRDVG